LLSLSLLLREDDLLSLSLLLREDELLLLLPLLLPLLRGPSDERDADADADCFEDDDRSEPLLERCAWRELELSDCAWRPCADWRWAERTGARTCER
jgi:hypothetical protein